MANSQGSDSCICVVFHVPPGVVFDVGAAGVQRAMEDAFGDKQRLGYRSGETREIVYQLKKPARRGNAVEEFFQSLERIFISLGSHSPHFTENL